MDRIFAFLFIVVLIIGGLAGCMIGYPQYRVYSQEMRGKAAYVEAEQDRRVKVLEATAFKDSATQLAEAEIIRARGTAEANRIVADGLGGPEGYLRYLFIEKLSSGDNREVIYIPTEAGLPLLEAGKR